MRWNVAAASALAHTCRREPPPPNAGGGFHCAGPPTPAALAAIQTSAAAVFLWGLSVFLHWFGQPAPEGGTSKPGPDEGLPTQADRHTSPEAGSNLDSAWGTSNEERQGLLDGPCEWQHPEVRVTGGSTPRSSAVIERRRASLDVPVGGDGNGRAAAHPGAGLGREGGPWLRWVLNATAKQSWVAGAELGVLAFAANAFTVVGFQVCMRARARRPRHQPRQLGLVRCCSHAVVRQAGRGTSRSGVWSASLLLDSKQ
jgi:hypothetical protein